MARLAEPPGYRPSDSQDSPLVRVLRAHLDDFLEQVRGEAGGLPAFVERQLRALIDCGDLCRGFLRAECDRCRAALIVPFSCKGRVCPSCAGRRMSEEAAHLVESVLTQCTSRLGSVLSCFGGDRHPLRDQSTLFLGRPPRMVSRRRASTASSSSIQYGARWVPWSARMLVTRPWRIQR